VLLLHLEQNQKFQNLVFTRKQKILTIRGLNTTRKKVVDKGNKFILPNHVLEIWSGGRTKPIPSVWDFGFVNDEVIKTAKRKPYFEVLDTTGKQKEVYFKTPEYDIYLLSSITGFELFLLYDSENKDSVVIATNQLKKYKIKFEE
jgi:hypothetical protein